MTGRPPAAAAVPAVLAHVQRQLEAIHDVQSPAEVAGFLCDRRSLEALGAQVRAPEEVFLLELPGELDCQGRARGEAEIDLGLYLAPELFERLRGLDPAGRSGLSLVTEQLASFSTLTEGVSHVIYLLRCAEAERRVSQLELEVQGEVDKFAVAALHLWGRDRRGQVDELWERLFGRLELRAGLGPLERDRYTRAFEVGRRYARRLIAQQVRPGRLMGFLGELRRTYRLGAEEKLHAMAA